MIRYQLAIKQFEDQQAVYSIEENLVGLLNDVVVAINNPDGNNPLRFIRNSSTVWSTSYESSTVRKSTLVTNKVTICNVRVVY